MSDQDYNLKSEKQLTSDYASTYSEGLGISFIVIVKDIQVGKEGNVRISEGWASKLSKDKDCLSHNMHAWVCVHVIKDSTI